MYLTGIDEAGYGPILGPLVVTAVTFRVPDRSADRCLWELLERSITPRAKSAKSDPRLPVCDSKKLHAGSDKLARLERTALAILGMIEPECGSVSRLVRAIGEEWTTYAADIPWFSGTEVSLPLRADEADVRVQRAAVASNMAASGIRLHNIRSVILPAREFNRMVAATRNKSAVLFWATLRLLTKALRDQQEAHRFHLDRHGGRTNYGSLLMKSLDIDRLHVVREEQDSSVYTLTHLPHLCEVGFYQKGEDRFMPIALASIVSKYLREICMHLFNRFWCDRIEGLERTAGYYTDGSRFLEEIRPHLRRLRIEETMLARTR